MNETAVAHKDMTVRGGGERLAEDLALTLDAPLYTARARIENIATEKSVDVRPLFTDDWQRLLFRLPGPITSVADRYFWQQDSDALEEFDTIVTSGNQPLWYVPREHQTLVAYCHSPPRHLYDLNHRSDAEGLERLIHVIRDAKRVRWRKNMDKPDRWVVNSELVARRLQLYANVDGKKIDVVYPPVAVSSFDPDIAPTGDRYLYVGRLTPAKRVTWLAERASETDLPLTIAGDGPEREAVESAAGASVNVLGYVSEDRKRELLAAARAFIMPAENEDFGMAPVEALASGTPVLAVSEGYAQHQVRDGENGYIFDPTADRFAAAVRRFERDGVSWSAEQCRQFAGNFDRKQFRAGIRAAVARAQEETKVDPDHDLPTDATAGEAAKTNIAADGGGR